MEYKIAWSERAKQDLVEIRDYYASRDPSAGARLIDQISSKIAALSQFPHIGEVYSRSQLFVLRETQIRDYRIFYETDEAGLMVRVVTVRHSSRKEPEFN